MITTAANNYADALLAKMKQYDESARMAAVEYARTDNKAAQLDFKRYTELSSIFQKLHGESCQFMHAIEAEMRDKLKAEAAAQAGAPGPA